MKPVGGLRKRRRDRNLNARRRQKPKERTREYCGSQKRVTVAGRRNVSHCTGVAWRRKNVVRETGTLEICGRRKEFAVSGIKATPCAKLARGKGRSHEGPSVEQERRKNQTRNKFARGTRKGRTFRRRQLMRREGTSGTRNQDFEEQLLLGNERTTSGIYRRPSGWRS
jgi:hypothetical protein